LKKRYFMFGFGAGMIAACIIFFIIYAKQREAWVRDVQSAANPRRVAVQITPPPTAAPTLQPTEPPSPSEEPLIEEPLTEEPLVEEFPTEVPPTEEPIIEEPASETILVVIPRGTYGGDICRILYENGIVPDAAEFQTFLAENNYMRNLQFGEFNLNSGMSYQEISEILRGLR